MRPVSDAFLRTLRGSHRRLVEARIVAPGQIGVEPVGTLLTVLAGDVHLDGTAQIRSTLDLTVDGTNLWPSPLSDLTLAPYGNEIHVRRGVRLGSGATEWVSLGYHRIEDIDQDLPPDGPIRLDGSDRMAGIIDARLLAPVPFEATATLGDVVERLVTDVYPWATIEWDDATDADTLGAALVAEQDRYKFIDDLVTARGKIWYWNHRGILTIRDIPAATIPVWDVNHGQSGVLVKFSRQLTRESVYNAVVASGDAATDSLPVWAAVVDNNPASPTYWHGSFGQVPKYYSSPMLTTNGQAEAAATTMLAKTLGLRYSADFTAIPNPALEPFDPVRISYSGRSPREIHVLEKLSVPLLANAVMPATTREQTVTVIGAV